MQPFRRIPVLICALLAGFLVLPPYSLSAAASKSKSASSKSSKSKSSSAKSKSSGTKSAKAKGRSSSKTRKARSARRPPSQRAPEPARIQEIQQALAQRGFPCEPNGVWDAATVESLKRFQESQNINNLTGRGKLDSLTLIALGLGPQRGNQPSAPAQSQPLAPPGQPEGKNQ